MPVEFEWSDEETPQFVPLAPRQRVTKRTEAPEDPSVQKPMDLEHELWKEQQLLRTHQELLALKRQTAQIEKQASQGLETSGQTTAQQARIQQEFGFDVIPSQMPTLDGSGPTPIAPPQKPHSVGGYLITQGVWQTIHDMFEWNTRLCPHPERLSYRQAIMKIQEQVVHDEEDYALTAYVQARGVPIGGLPYPSLPTVFPENCGAEASLK
jgi:hypothetical protein